MVISICIFLKIICISVWQSLFDGYYLTTLMHISPCKLLIIYKFYNVISEWKLRLYQSLQNILNFRDCLMIPQFPEILLFLHYFHISKHGMTAEILSSLLMFCYKMLIGFELPHFLVGKWVYYTSYGIFLNKHSDMWHWGFCFCILTCIIFFLKSTPYSQFYPVPGNYFLTFMSSLKWVILTIIMLYQILWICLDCSLLIFFYEFLFY
jgi:hypothetical protein